MDLQLVLLVLITFIYILVHVPLHAHLDIMETVILILVNIVIHHVLLVQEQLVLNVTLVILHIYMIILAYQSAQMDIMPIQLLGLVTSV